MKRPKLSALFFRIGEQLKFFFFNIDQRFPCQTEELLNPSEIYVFLGLLTIYELELSKPHAFFVLIFVFLILNYNLVEQGRMGEFFEEFSVFEERNRFLHQKGNLQEQPKEL